MLSNKYYNLPNLPINELVIKLGDKKNDKVNFEDLKYELEKYDVETKEYNNLAIIYYENNKNNRTTDKDKDNEINKDDETNENNLILKNNEKDYETYENVEYLVDKRRLEESCKSYILDKNSLLPIGSQYNKIIYNDTYNLFEKYDNQKVNIQKCYEGTMVLVYNENNEWFVSTRRCIDGSKSKWKNESYKNMFYETIENKFDLEALDKNNCYHFVLVNYKNKNLINYDYLFGKEYQEIVHVSTTKKYTLEEIDYEIENTIKVENLNYDKTELCDKLNELSNQDVKNKRLTCEGFIIKIYDKNGIPEIHKLQTNLYKRLNSIKPNNNNENKCYVELYKNNKLNLYLYYTSNYKKEIVKRVDCSFKNLCREILNLYHMTRNRKNEELYSKLTPVYRRVLYGLHGIYIERTNSNYDNVQTKDSFNDMNKTENNIYERILNRKSINYYDVYNYLKTLSINNILRLYHDRTKYENDKECKFINHNCIYTKTQMLLMFDK